MADDKEDVSGVADGQYASEIAARDEEVTKLLAGKNKLKALLVALQNPPITTKSAEIKVKDDIFSDFYSLGFVFTMNHYHFCKLQDLNCLVVEKVIASFTDSDIPTVVAGLDLEACDVLMKYLYRLMGKASNCGTVLKLHGQISDKAGIGSIIRVITDRKQV